MKKLLSAAAAAAMIAFSSPVTAFSEEENAGGFVISYTVYDGKATVTGCSGSDIFLMIPSEIDGCPVTAIADDAFSRNSDMIICTIPDSVEHIGERAFSYCETLTSVTIGKGVSIIGDNAFTTCSSLSSIDVMKDNPAYTTIDGSLYGKDGDTLLIYAGSSDARINSCTKEIGKGAFFGKSSLTSVSIPDSVVSIGDNAFAGCLSLKSVDIPDSVTTLGRGCFMSCSTLETVSLSRSVKSIPDNCFHSCPSLRNVPIPDNITSIGDGAFYSCADMSNIYLPAAVKTIGIESIGRRYNVRSTLSENISGFVIRGEKGSAAEKYASELGLGFTEGHIQMGDVNDNGRIDAVDASLVLAEYALTSTGSSGKFRGDQNRAADWNSNGSINAVDASLILAEYAAISTQHS